MRTSRSATISLSLPLFTALNSSGQMYGANNQPQMIVVYDFEQQQEKGTVTGTWHWDVTSPQTYYEKINEDTPYWFFNPLEPNGEGMMTEPFLNKITVHRKQ